MSEKSKKLKALLDTPEYQEYKQNKIKNQKRKEKAYKFTSIGNSTNTVRNLILANIIMFIVEIFYPSVIKNFAIYNISEPNFHFYQLLTSMFLHVNFIHIAVNMLILWSFGNQIEKIIGTKKFINLYFISGIISGIFWMFLGAIPAVGASGALSGIFAAFIFIAPETKVLMFFIIPMKLKYAVYGFGILSLIFGILSLINTSLGFGLGHFAHLGGMVGGLLITYYWRKNKLIPSFVN